MNLTLLNNLHFEFLSHYRSGGSYQKLGVQITYESLKNGCAKSAIYLIGTQKVGALRFLCSCCSVSLIESEPSRTNGGKFKHHKSPVAAHHHHSL